MAKVVFTDRSDGDLRDRCPFGPPSWTVMRQVHGSRAIVVDEPGQSRGIEADAAVVTISSAAVAVRTADCAPIAVVAHGSGVRGSGVRGGGVRGGGVAVIHAGWRGLQAGVVGEAIDALSRHADGPYRAILGPCIHPECYEFSESDLAALIDRFGPTVRGATTSGQPALDLPAAVVAACSEAGIDIELDLSTCTACTGGNGGSTFYSHRARGDQERQALVAWIEDPS